MATAVLGVRLLLAAIFGFAAAAKLQDRASFTRSLPPLGVPAGAVRIVGLVVPAAELIIAGLLLPASTARWGAGLALIVLAIFTLVVLRAASRGVTAACACFGATVAEPVGGWTVARNSLLMALTALVLLSGPGSSLTTAGADLAQATSAERTLTVALLIALLALAGCASYIARLLTAAAASQADLSRVRGELTAARHAAAQPESGGLPEGDDAPPFELPRLEGDRSSLTSLGADGRPLLLVFMSAHCTACHQLWPDIERWQHDPRVPFAVACVCSGSDQSIEMRVMGHQVTHVLLEGEAQVGDAYGISLRPSAVFVANGRIASPTVAGVEGIRNLAATPPGQPRAL